MLSLVVVLVLTLSFAAACGDDEEDEAATDGVDVETTEVVEEATEEEDTAAADETEAVMAEETEESTEEATVDTDVVETEVAGADTTTAVGLAGCFQENLNAEVINDLRAGETETADAAFRGCIEDELSPELAAQADPIIEQATACAEQVSEDLTDEDVAAIEEGDQAQVQSFSNDVLTCVSEELGVELS